MEAQPATKRSIALVLAMASISVACLALATSNEARRRADARQFAAAAEPTERDSPAPDGQALFNTRDFTGWTFRDADRAKVWSVADVEIDPNDKSLLRAAAAKHSDGTGQMFRGPGHGTDIYTEKSFGDCQLHVEFMIPDNSNSGVYLMGQYEVQILSTFGKPADKLGPGDCGGIYHTKAPSANPMKPYGSWNTYDITFRAPRFDAAGKKTENARFIEVLFNGVKIHENVEAPSPTGGELPGGEKPTGPLLLQGDHGICAFRNIRLKPLELK